MADDFVPSETDPQNKPRRKISTIRRIIDWLTVCCLLIFMIALLLPAVKRERPGAHLTQCKNNLKQIGLALQTYESIHGALPPAFTIDAEGKPLHSWRTLILPYLDQHQLYEKIDLSKPWDDPVNEAAKEKWVSSYICPSNIVSQNLTTYLAITDSDGQFQSNGPAGAQSIDRNLGSLMRVVEVPIDRAVPWMSPTDTDLDCAMRERPKSTLMHSKGWHALLDDGTVRIFDVKDRSPH